MATILQEYNIIYIKQACILVRIHTYIHTGSGIKPRNRWSGDKYSRGYHNNFIINYYDIANQLQRYNINSQKQKQKYSNK